jgi:cobaltochelatase CobN
MSIDLLAADVQRELDVIDRMRVPAGSKILGTAPEGDTLVDMVTAMLSPDLVNALAAHDADPQVLARDLVAHALETDPSPHHSTLRAASGPVAPVPSPTRALSAAATSSPGAGAVIEEARAHAAALATAPREVEAVFEALEGRWIAPGPMDDPIRKPEALPPGRSLYDFDVAEVPTPEAEALGIRQAEALIAKHRQAHDGAWPTSFAFAIFSGEIAKNRGVTEAQILHLLGTRVVRDARGLVTGVQLIPREELGRPRVDVMVTTSGTFRDHYPTVLDLFAEGTRLAAESSEGDNPVRAGVQATETTLRQAGEDAERAASLARARVFAPAPGAYSPSIQFLAKAGDQRGDQAKMAELYTSRLSHAYGAGLYGEAARSAFERQVARVDAATMSRSDDVNGMLDHPMTAGFLGGLNLSAEAVTGAPIDLYVSNLRDPGNASIETAAAEIQRELRTRYFNPSWVAEMQEHGYEGARTFMYLTDHLDLWNTTATRTVSTADWDEVKRVYVDDTFGLDMDAFFERHNPHAQQVVLANLLGAASRGHWTATAEERAQVAARLAASARTHGIVCEAHVCRNPALTRLVVESLEGRADAVDLAEGYQAAIRAATVAGPVDATAARGAAPPAIDAVGPPPPGVLVQGPRVPAPTPPVSAAPSAPPALASPPAPAPPMSSPAGPIVTGRMLETITTPRSLSGARDGVSPRWPWYAALAFGLVVVGWISRRVE